jgi:hypothetical protein
MRTLIALLILGVASLAHAGDTPTFPFKLGEWEFELSSAGTPGGGPIVAVLEAKNKRLNATGTVALDYRWYALMFDQFEKGHRAAKPFYEALVAFAGREWSRSPDGEKVLKAMKESPPTPDFKRSYDFLTTEPE